jgi:hypothetical protein
MKSRLSSLLAAAVVLPALALPAAAQAVVVGPYYPSGPQLNVARTTPVDNGWRVCFTDDFSDNATPVADVLAACKGEYLMLASGPVGSPDYQLLAAAPRADVLFDAGYGNVTQLSNGTEWYFSADWSWGFANGGDTVSRNSCDTDFTINTDLRMCWHTSGGLMNGGYRVGNYVTFGTDYDRVVLEPVLPSAVGSPNPLVFADQTQSTVSPRQTVTLTVSAAGLDRTLGELVTAGANAGEFDVISENCPDMAPADGSTVTCTAQVRFVPQGVGARTATLGFANTNDTVTLQGNGIAPPQGPVGPQGIQGIAGTDGTNGVDGTNGSNGINGINGSAGKNGLDGLNGKDGVNGINGAKGDRGPRGTSLKVTKVGCKVQARGTGARIVCRFNRRSGRNWLVQLRDSRGALSTARGNGKTTMAFLSTRKPRGKMHAFVLEGLPTS